METSGIQDLWTSQALKTLEPNIKGNLGQLEGPQGQGFVEFITLLLFLEGLSSLTAFTTLCFLMISACSQPPQHHL